MAKMGKAKCIFEKANVTMNNIGRTVKFALCLLAAAAAIPQNLIADSKRPEASEKKNEFSLQSPDSAEMLKSKAEAGDPAAQFNLAVCYYNGVGVEKNEAEAFKWSKKAA